MMLSLDGVNALVINENISKTVWGVVSRQQKEDLMCPTCVFPKHCVCCHLNGF